LINTFSKVVFSNLVAFVVDVVVVDVAVVVAFVVDLLPRPFIRPSVNFQLTFPPHLQ